MTSESKEELKAEIIEWLDAFTCDVHQSKDEYEYVADQLMQLFTSYHQQQLEQAVRKAVEPYQRTLDNVAGGCEIAGLDILAATIRGFIAELQSIKEDKSKWVKILKK